MSENEFCIVRQRDVQRAVEYVLPPRYIFCTADTKDKISACCYADAGLDEYGFCRWNTDKNGDFGDHCHAPRAQKLLGDNPWLK